MSAVATNHLFSLPETIGKLIFPTAAPAKITRVEEETVTVEEERTLVIKSNGKRKRDDHENEEGCNYIRLERNLVKKFRLPEDADMAAVTAEYQERVLTVTVGKLPPKPKTVQFAVS